MLGLEPLHLRLLDEALDGALYPVLVRVVRAGGDPILSATRARGSAGPSSWSLHVEGQEGGTFNLDSTNVIAVAIAAHVWLGDVLDDLRADLRAGLGQIPEGAFDEFLPFAVKVADKPS